MTWKNEFLKLLFSGNSEEVQIANDLKKKNLPISLYRYRPFNPEYLLKEISENTVRLSSPASFNDPFDCVWNLDDEKVYFELFFERPGIKKLFTQEEIESAKKNDDPILYLARLSSWKDGAGMGKYHLADQLKEKLQKFINSRKTNRSSERENNFSVCCFSEVKDSILMWSFYADHHKGCCIEYDISNEPAQSESLKFLYPVVYSAKLFDLTEHFKKPVVTPLAIKSAISKSSEWSKEKEWRLVWIHKFQLEEEKRAWKFSPIKAIYLGAKMKYSDHKKIEESCGKKVLIYQAKLSKSYFKLEFELISGPSS
jgi:hypothetical protein